AFARVQEAVSKIRAIRAEYRVAPKTRLAAAIKPRTDSIRVAFLGERDTIVRLAQLSELRLDDGLGGKGAHAVLADGSEVFVALADAIDVRQECRRPPGEPPRTAPPAIQRTAPESGRVVPDLHGDAVVQFDEVIDEMPSRGGPAGAISGLAQKIVLSPVGSDVKVSWHRSSIHVSPREGWKRGRVYHLQVLPGIADLRRNATKAGTTIVFTTGPAIPAARLRGTVLLWAEQRTLPQAVIRAAPLPDTV